MSEPDDIKQLWKLLYSDRLAFVAVIIIPILSGIIGLYLR